MSPYPSVPFHPEFYRLRLCGARWIVCLILSLVPCLLQATVFTWIGAGSDNNYNNPANWSPSGVPGSGDQVVFAGSTGTTPQLTAAGAASQLTFQSGAAAF